MPTVKERRKKMRVTIEQLVKFNLGHEDFIFVDAKNLSEDGIYCSTDEPVDLYQHVFLMFTIHTEKVKKEYKVDGVIMRCEKRRGQYHIGIRFDRIEPKFDKDFKEIVGIK